MNNADRYDKFFGPVVDTLFERRQVRVVRKTNAHSGRLFESGYDNSIQYEARLAQGNKARVALYIDSNSSERNKQLVEALHQHYESIESALGPLDWEQERDTRRRRIEITRPGSIDDDADMLAEIQTWMVDNLLKFQKAFDPHLKELVG